MSLHFLTSPEEEQQIGKTELAALAAVYAEYLTPVHSEVELQLFSLEKMQELNKESRGINEPTDVLSFPIFNNRSEILELDSEQPTLIGTIVICPDKASIYGESLAQLVHHGLLHICGFDHEQDLAGWKQEEGVLLEKLAKQGLELPGIPL